MNKKCITIVGGTVAGILALTGCQGDTYTYEVSGTVEARQIDYDCPGEDVAMDAVAFSAGSGRGSGSSSTGRSAKGSTKAPKSEDVGKAPKSSPTGAASKGATATATPSKTPKGVKLSKKPDKPEKIKGGKVPKPIYASKPKGCETEYELYISNEDGLFEQDVRQQDYENCTEGEQFAACTES